MATMQQRARGEAQYADDSRNQDDFVHSGSSIFHVKSALDNSICTRHTRELVALVIANPISTRMEDPASQNNQSMDQMSIGKEWSMVERHCVVKSSARMRCKDCACCMIPSFEILQCSPPSAGRIPDPPILRAIYLMQGCRPYIEFWLTLNPMLCSPCYPTYLCIQSFLDDQACIIPCETSWLGSTTSPMQSVHCNIFSHSAVGSLCNS